jgi:hypothetical protein
MTGFFIYMLLGYDKDASSVPMLVTFGLQIEWKLTPPWLSCTTIPVRNTSV